MSAREIVWVLAAAAFAVAGGCSHAESAQGPLDAPIVYDDMEDPDAGIDAALDAPPVMGKLPAQYPFRVLQLNLCNSGFAACYDNGLSIPEGVSAIQTAKPDLVTLNEICQNDLATLSNAMTNLHPGSKVVATFKAAGDRRTNAPYKCKNGSDYGIGLVAHIPGPYAGHQFFSGLYTSQDTSSAEERAWVCLRASGALDACTTHLATVGSIALTQCKDLMNNIIPGIRTANGGSVPTVIAGDLNLKFGGSPNAQDCVPAGYFRKGDGDVQHVMASTDFTFSSSTKISMTHTDHDGWFVEVTAP
jgi:hypothetical protein